MIGRSRRRRAGGGRPVVIAEHHRRAFHLQHAVIGIAIIAVDETQRDLRMRIADRQLGLRQSLGMRTEHHRAGFGGAVRIGHRGLRQRLVQRRHQARAHRRRAHADEFDAGEIGTRHQVAFAQHHRDHRRHRGEPGAAIAADRLDIGACGKLRQQHDGGVRRTSELGERQRVHVIERRGDQITVAVEPGGEPRLHDPDVALMREHNALRRSGRAGGVEEHRRLVGRRNDRVERAGIEECIERFRLPCRGRRCAKRVRWGGSVSGRDAVTPPRAPPAVRDPPPPGEGKGGPNRTTGNAGGQSAARCASQNMNFAPASRMMK